MRKAISTLPQSFAFRDLSLHDDIFLSDDRLRVRQRMGEFNWKMSATWARLRCLYGSQLSLAELISIADIIAQRLDIKADRDARRRKSVMIRWFDENWVQIQVILHIIVLENTTPPPTT
jgi:hypothetical protein